MAKKEKLLKEYERGYKKNLDKLNELPDVPANYAERATAAQNLLNIRIQVSRQMEVAVFEKTRIPEEWNRDPSILPSLELIVNKFKVAESAAVYARSEFKRQTGIDQYTADKAQSFVVNSRYIHNWNKAIDGIYAVITLAKISMKKNVVKLAEDYEAIIQSQEWDERGFYYDLIWANCDSDNADSIAMWQQGYEEMCRLAYLLQSAASVYPVDLGYPAELLERGKEVESTRKMDQARQLVESKKEAERRAHAAAAKKLTEDRTLEENRKNPLFRQRESEAKGHVLDELLNRAKREVMTRYALEHWWDRRNNPSENEDQWL